MTQTDLNKFTPLCMVLESVFSWSCFSLRSLPVFSLKSWAKPAVATSTRTLRLPSSLTIFSVRSQLKASAKSTVKPKLLKKRRRTRSNLTSSMSLWRCVSTILCAWPSRLVKLDSDSNRPVQSSLKMKKILSKVKVMAQSRISSNCRAQSNNSLIVIYSTTGWEDCTATMCLIRPATSKPRRLSAVFRSTTRSLARRRCVTLSASFSSHVSKLGKAPCPRVSTLINPY